MTDFSSGMRRQGESRPAAAIKRVMVAATVSLSVIWSGGYLLQLAETDLLAASLVVIVLALVAIVICVVRGRREIRNAVPPVQDAATAVEPAERRRPRSSGSPARYEPAMPLNSRHWSLDVFAAIDAKRFAAVCETWFSWAGFDTRSETHRADEGVDIWLHAARMPGPVAIVRCKHWRDKPVALQDMQDFMGLVAKFQSAHGTYTTTSTYTPEALQFARENGIDAVDGRGLLRRIQTRTRQRQQALLAVALSGQS